MSGRILSYGKWGANVRVYCTGGSPLEVTPDLFPPDSYFSEPIAPRFGLGQILPDTIPPLYMYHLKTDAKNRATLFVCTWRFEVNQSISFGNTVYGV